MQLTHAGRHRADRSAARSLVSILAVAAIIAVLALTSLSAGVAAAVAAPSAEPAQATSDASLKRVRTAAAQKKAVIVVGPVGSVTTTYINKANAIATAAEGWGMEVVKIYHPNATWSRVVAEANGADFFVYLGHGNGWPSPYGTFQEDTKNGLGLNPAGGSTNTYDTRYYGADKIRAKITFAPNAIVLLNKICYANGNAEEGMPIPTTDVARQRVDNFAAGFLDSGASVVYALGWQPGENLVDSLFSTTPKTMDEIFMTKFGGNRDGSYAPYFGWIGWKPNLYFDSDRVAGARVHLDPDPQEGYLRGVTGNLEMTTDQWLGLVDPDDVDPPVVSDVSGDQAANTIPAGENAVPVFTPNGDKISDTITLRHTVSEASFVTVEIVNGAGTTIRKMTSWSAEGPGSTVWDGKNNGGKKVRDGRFGVVVTAKDRAGNVSEPVSTAIKALTVMKSPTASPVMFYSADGDALAQSTAVGVTLKGEAALTWRVLNKAGSVVRVGPVDQVMPAGAASWQWDGLDDDGNAVKDGKYVAMVTATTGAGTYSHKKPVWVMPFRLKGRLKVTAGQTQTLTLLTAEPVDGWPRIEIKQPGMSVYKLYPVRYTTTRFTAKWTVKSGATGPVAITVTTTDSGGGVQVKTFKGRLN